MKKSESQVNASKGRRYTRSEKEEILAYVAKVNEEKGRGGQTAASKKFKISPLTISGWARHGAGGSLNGSAAISSRPIGGKLRKLQELHHQMAGVEKELGLLRARFNALKASL